jgi:hypothetical protein
MPLSALIAQAGRAEANRTCCDMDDPAPSRSPVPPFEKGGAGGIYVKEARGYRKFSRRFSLSSIRYFGLHSTSYSLYFRISLEP